MAKTNIIFNDKNYSINESVLAPSTIELKSYLTTTMSGTGAVINLDGIDYNVDATKLSNAMNSFVTHLGTITGNGTKVIVNGVEYFVDSTKISGAISDLEANLSELGEERLEGDGGEYYTLAPTPLSFRSSAPLNELQEVQINGVTVDPSNYTLEEGSTIVTFPIDYLKTLNIGNYEVAIASDSKTVKGGFTVAAPELNEYGFYYNQPYVADVESFGGTTVFFMRDNGIVDVIVSGGYTEACSYAIDSDDLVINSTLGTFTGYIADDGIYCNEVATTFVLNTEIITADNDYMYVYDEVLGGYIANPIDGEQEAYASIKTGINDNLTVKINDYAFSDNRNLISTPEIPNAVTIIGTNAFANCTQLKIVTLPASLAHIGSGAFYGCTNLTNIVFEGTCEQWNATSKDGDYWNYNVPATHVHCIDGDVAL